MISTTVLVEDMLVKLEEDLKVVKTVTSETNSSIYNFAGYRNGQPVGISKTALVSLNRGGQLFQFLAGYYTRATDINIKNRIAVVAAKVYNVFSARPVFSSCELHDDGASYETSGQFTTDPSGPLMLLGLMMIDKQGILDNPNFDSNCVSQESFIREIQIPRQALKLDRALKNDDSILNSFASGTNFVWHNQKMAKVGVNGIAMSLATISLYNKMYGIAAYATRYIQSYNALRLISTNYGSTYNTEGTLVTTTSAGQFPGTRLCLAVGGDDQSRGAFPSIGYNSLVVMALTLQAFAEKANTYSRFSDLKDAIQSHPLQTDALKILDYYDNRFGKDGYLYELGAPNNEAFDASQYRDAWKAHMQSKFPNLTDIQIEVKFDLSGQFDQLISKSIHPGQAGYSYLFMWSMYNHAIFNKLATYYAPEAIGKTSLDIDYSNVGTSASVSQAFAATSEAVAVRVASGLGIALIQDVSTVGL